MNPIRLRTETPLIEPRAFAGLLADYSRRLETIPAVPSAGEPDGLAKLREHFKPRTSVNNGVGILEISGPLAYKPDLFEMAWYGMEDSAAVLSSLRELQANPEVSSILLNLNSPGGFVTGGPEVADAVASSRKPVVAWTGGMAASLAYWIGSQAGAFIATRSSLVGSIGAYIAVADFQKLYESAGVKMHVFTNKEGRYKAAGLTGAPITEDHASNWKASAQRTFDQFRSDILRARPDVPTDAMEGQVFDGAAAKKMKLVDAIGDLSYALVVARRRGAQR